MHICINFVFIPPFQKWFYVVNAYSVKKKAFYLNQNIKGQTLKIFYFVF